MAERVRADRRGVERGLGSITQHEGMTAFIEVFNSEPQRYLGVHAGLKSPWSPYWTAASIGLGASVPYLDDNLVREAARRMATDEVITSRRQTFFWRWLALKKAGLSAGATAEFSSTIAQQAANDLLKLDAPAAGEMSYFQPFSGDWVKAQGTTNWAIQVLYTTTTSRQTNWERAVWTAPQQHPERAGIWPFRGLDEEQYLAGLQDALLRAVPILAIAIWRFRTSEVPNDVTDESLIQRFIEEYRLTRGELEAAFTDDGSGLLGAVVAYDEEGEAPTEDPDA